jgi:hypothetical protein
MGAGGTDLIQAFNKSIAHEGVMVEQPIPLGSWKLAAGTTIAAAGAGIVGVGAIMTSYNGLIWDPAADTGDAVICDWCTPGDFRGIGGSEKYPSKSDGPQLQLLVLARKLDKTGSATDNTDLRLTGDMLWLYSNPDETLGARGGDTALNSLTTKATALLDAKAAATTEEAFHWYALDIGARLEAESKTLKPYSAVQIALSVDDTVGTNLAVEVIATAIRYRRHLAIEPKSRR